MYVAGLTDLDLRNNQICRARGYKVLVLRRLPNLVSLDGVPLTDQEKVCVCVCVNAGVSAHACARACVTGHKSTLILPFWFFHASVNTHVCGVTTNTRHYLLYILY